MAGIISRSGIVFSTLSAMKIKIHTNNIKWHENFTGTKKHDNRRDATYKQGYDTSFSIMPSKKLIVNKKPLLGVVDLFSHTK
ncbi:hypothetical protein J3U75_02295 [Snodgrassella sp. B3088]|nr:hypothetical protein [Snodgrassella sp. B3088]